VFFGIVPGGNPQEKPQDGRNLGPMDDSPDHGPLLLVGCALCDRLHEPRSALDSNSICAGCAAGLAGPAFSSLDRRSTPDGEFG
jgi:hypothetical protein